VFELLAAVLLSAQATDVGVNKATRSLFRVANTPQKIIALGLAGLEAQIKTIGLFRSKARHLLQTCEILVAQHGGVVPRTREALEALPGERRKLHYTPPPTLGKPVIAALHGRVSGGGLELALGCDIRIAAHDTVFALPEVTRGIVPGSGGLYWLPRIVGLGRALEIILTGEPVNAQEALRIGLVNRVVPRDELHACAHAMASRIAANAPLAVQAARDTVMRSLGTGPLEGLEISENLGRGLRTTADYAEGFDAFAQKRPPRFVGR
jgi:hypothetical protein